MQRQGNISNAWFNLAKIHSNESYAHYDIAKAQLCYSNALNLYITDYKQNPNDYIAYRLGNMYLKGLGTDMNINQAIYWFSEAEKFENANATYQLGYIYHSENTDYKTMSLQVIILEKHYRLILSGLITIKQIQN